MTNHFRIENNVRVYDLNNSLVHLEAMGKKHYGKRFHLYPADRAILYKLLVYAVQDEENCAKHNLDMSKGILLTGPVGCGKTTLMFLLRYFVLSNEMHLLKPSRELAFEFIREGYSVIQKVGNQNKVICFDDLGVEQSIKYYGNECNVMGEILLSRYDLFVCQGTKTHATTNLNATELEQLYGQRVRSRMRQMFNLIAFDKDVGDKRR